MSTIVLNTVLQFVLFFVHHDSFFLHSFIMFGKHLFTGISMVICKIGWSIRSWLSDYISFSFYKSYCRHDIYWILVAFMIAASALIKVSKLHGLYRHLYTSVYLYHIYAQIDRWVWRLYAPNAPGVACSAKRITGLHVCSYYFRLCHKLRKSVLVQRGSTPPTPLYFHGTRCDWHFQIGRW